MAASDYVPIFFKNRLHLEGRPQMSTRPSVMGPMKSSPRVVVTSLGSRFCPWSTLRSPHDEQGGVFVPRTLDVCPDALDHR
jgi:hypothetical protein